MSSEAPTLLRSAALLVTGVVLMFIAHLLAIAGFVAMEGLPYQPPYWWGYLLLYPVVGAAAARLSRANWQQIALCLCIPPILYFLTLGMVESMWFASDGALWGALVAFVLTALVVSFARSRVTALPSDGKV